MSGGTSNFTAGPGGPLPGSSVPLFIRVRPQGSTPLNGGGGALPGDGSYGDPIQGFRQINQQMAQTQRTLTAASTVSNGINAGFETANAARTAAQRAQLAAGFDAAQARRETMFAAPPVTGPMLPPNFAETARMPAPTTVPPPSVAPPGLADPPRPNQNAGAAVAVPPMPMPVPTGGVPVGLGAAGAAGAAGRIPLPGPLGLATLLGGLAATGVAVLSGRTQGTVPTSGQLVPGLGYRFDPAAPGGAQVILTRFDTGTGIEVPYTSLTANPQGALTTRDGAVVGRLQGDAFEIDVNALQAAVPAGPLGSPGLTPPPPAPGPEGFTPTAPGGVGTGEGFGIAPPMPPLEGFTPPGEVSGPEGLVAADPGLLGPSIHESRADPSLTRPTGSVDGSPTGPRSTNRPEAQPKDKQQVASENAVADRLAAQGYAVVQNPTVGPVRALTPETMKDLGLNPRKDPDLLINGRVFDTFTPVVDTASSIRAGIFTKVEDRQTDRVVVDLRGTTQTDATIRAALRAQPVPGLKEVLTLTETGIGRAFP